MAKKCELCAKVRALGVKRLAACRYHVEREKYHPAHRGRSRKADPPREWWRKIRKTKGRP